jgi:hypothetical protein
MRVRSCDEGVVMRWTCAALILAACSGTKGDKGDPGPAGDSVSIAQEAAGANCAGGGLKLTSGGITNYLCNGLNGMGSLAVMAEPSGANCANGGVKITSSSGTSYVCNGASGSGGGVTTTSEPAGANCASGGVKLTSSSGSNYVCNGASGSGRMVTDSSGNVLGEMISMLHLPNYKGTNTTDLDIVYRDSSGMVLARLADGSLRPFYAQVVWFSAALCQGTPYLTPEQIFAGNDSGGLPAGSFVQIGAVANPPKTQPYYYRVASAALMSTTPASFLDWNGNCNVNSTAMTGAMTLTTVATPPAATVPGPLAFQ